MSRETDDRKVGTADLLAANDARKETQEREYPSAEREQRAAPERYSLAVEDARDKLADVERDELDGARDEPAGGAREELAALFEPDAASDFRARWSEVQSGFVDDPKRAVARADELVAQVMKSLAETFARQRSSIEAEVGPDDQASTENRRVALMRYRLFFDQLLSL